MPRPSKLVRPARKTRLGVQALEGREVPATLAVGMFDDVVNPFDGILSLREAITRANTLPGPDVIRLPAGEYLVTRTGTDNTNLLGDFDVKGSVTIRGAGGTATRIVADDTDERLFELHGPITARFQDLGLAGGGNGQSNGGAVQALTANIVLDRVVAEDNRAIRGGAVNAERGNVTVRDSRLALNGATGPGGAIAAGSGRVFLDRTTVEDNNSADAGGGIFVGTGRLMMSRSTVQDNWASADGGGIASDGAPVHLSDTTVQRNRAVDGGGVRVLGALTAAGSRIVSNQAAALGGGISADTVTLVRTDVGFNHAGISGGGVVANSATLDRSTVVVNTAVEDSGGLGVRDARLTASTVAGNTAGGEGGGLTATTLVLLRSTVSANHARRAGGGLAANTATLINSTVSGNTVDGHGAGMRLGFGGTILNSTIAFNQAGRFGGGIENEAGVVRVKNTIIARNKAVESGRDVFGSFESLGHNLVQDPDGGRPTGPDFGGLNRRDLVGVDPQLGPLAFANGGPTPTHALLAGSPAIDHGSNAGAPAVDQRGVARPRDGDGNGIRIVDIGAFEL